MSHNVPPDDFVALFYPEELRMIWAREFIREYLEDEHLRSYGGPNLDSLTVLANSWVREVAVKPVCLSRDDVEEAGHQILKEQS
jgi:hypothetical protein